MEALRREFMKMQTMRAKYRQLRESDIDPEILIKKNIIPEKIIRTVNPATVKTPKHMDPEKERLVNDILLKKKMTVDPERLNMTIQKIISKPPTKRREIIIISEIPAAPSTVSEITELCKALNLNGTPCKCRAKMGKFCAKHRC